MGLFGLFKKKKEDISKESAFADRLNLVQKREINVIDHKEEDSPSLVRDHCERVMEAIRQLEEAKVEYQAVTSYLNDIQKIDLIPMEHRNALEEAARKIITLTRERSHYQNHEIKIHEDQRQTIEKNSVVIFGEIQKMKKDEIYQNTIKNDMEHLEKEKESLLIQCAQFRKKQKYLKKVGLLTGVFGLALGVLFFALSNVFDWEMSLPYVVTLGMVSLSIFYIVIEGRKIKEGSILLDRKQKRAIRLLNRVKIHYVNTTNSLDYGYSKFGVHSAVELEFLWNQYLKVKELEEKYKKNTELLHYHNEILIKELKKFRIADADIWIYQSGALLDKKEMVEVRHRLNVRRQKLRDRIEYNSKLKTDSIEGIKKLLGEKPQLKSQVVEILKEYQINLDYC